MDTVRTQLSIDIPQTDITFVEMIAQRMGWKICKAEKPERISSIDISLEEAKKGAVKRFDSVDDLMQDLLK